MTVDYVLTFLGVLIILVTVLPVFHRGGLWWVRIFDFPCAQFAFCGALIVVAWGFFYIQGAALFFSTGVIPFLLGSLVIQGYRIYPYTIWASKESLSSNVDDCNRNISIFSANVLMKNHNSDRLLKLIKMYNPDLILLTETNGWWEEAVESLETNYHYTLKKPLENTYGVMLYSRLPLLGPKVEFLVEDDVPSLHATVQLLSGDTVDFYGLHPRPPRVNQDVHERDAELLIVGRLISRRQKPAIVAGDLNDVAWSHSTRLFLRSSGLLDPRIGRGFFNTFPTHLPFLRFPMDHIFHSKHMRLKGIQVIDDFGSDHYPIFASLYFYHGQKTSHVYTKDVRVESQKKIAEGLE